jgi:hypothetical protein
MSWWELEIKINQEQAPITCQAKADTIRKGKNQEINKEIINLATISLLTTIKLILHLVQTGYYNKIHSE